MRFEYLEPASIEEAVSLLTRFDGKAKIIAGGTDLLLRIRSREIRPEYVVDIETIPGLDYIRKDEKGLALGAATPIRALEKSPEVRRFFPVISRAAGTLGSVAIRNVATIGGNLCNAVPSADTVPALIGLSAEVRLAGLEGERVVPLESFFTGPGATALGRGEMLVEVRVPATGIGKRATYLKHSHRGSIDLAIVGVAVVAEVEPGTKICKDIRVVLGSAAPTPMRARRCEDMLRGKELDEELIFRGAEAAAGEARPRAASARASAEYRREMIKVFVRRALREVSS